MGNVPKAFCCLHRSDTKKTEKIIKSDALPFIRYRTYVSKEDFLSIYKLEQTIGKGYFSKVKLGYKINGDKRKLFAVKVIAKTSLDPDLEADFLNELRILKSLDHPNLIKLHEVYDNEKFYFLVMEHCSGGTVLSRLQELGLEGRKREDFVLNVLFQAIKAINYCHSIGVVHRDLKPENILFSSKEQTATIKIIDFGLSRKFSQNDVLTSFLGTPFFVAPEVIKQEYSKECDMWSIGATAFMLFTGNPPFNGKNKGDLLKNIKKVKLNFVPEEWSSYSKEAIDLLKNLLRKTPSNRLTPKKALTHKIFSELNSDTSRSSKIDKEQLINLLSYEKHNDFQSLYCHLALKEMKSDQINKLVKTFHAINVSHEGFISKEELRRVFAGSDLSVTEEELARVMKNVDQDCNGRINFKEFCVAASGITVESGTEIAAKVFSELDEDSVGEIDYTTIQKAMMREGRRLNDSKDLQKIVNEVNGSKEKISLEKFSEFVLKPKA